MFNVNHYDVSSESDIVRPSKRRRINLPSEAIVVEETSHTDSCSTPADSAISFGGNRRAAQSIAGVKVPAVLRPRAAFPHEEGDEQAVPECEALDLLERQWRAARSRAVQETGHAEIVDDDIYVELTDFSIYRPHNQGSTFAALNDLMPGSGWGHSIFQHLLFEGRLRIGNVSVWVQDVPFDTLSVDGYAVEVDTVRDKIYLQSPAAEARDVWYHLKSPSKHYSPFWHDYLWVAEFTKHAICYLAETKRVSLINFKQHFHFWAASNYGHLETFRKWHKQYGKTDFRRWFAAFPEYLRREAWNDGVDVRGSIRKQPIWSECHPDPSILRALPWNDFPMDIPTIVTPYAKWCFEKFYFAEMLQARTPISNDHLNYAEKWMKRRSWVPKIQSLDTSTTTRRKVRVGDIVALPRDTGGCWGDKSPKWYAYVHNIKQESYRDHRARRTRDRIYVFWLYEPNQTILREMRYPFSNELFFSDHCNCLGDRSDAIYADEVIAWPEVTLFPVGMPASGSIVRQTYITENALSAFVTLQDKHLHCEHQSAYSNDDKDWPVGSTLLARVKDSHLLEPVVVTQSLMDSGILVRRLLRAQRTVPSAAANILVYTDQHVLLKREQLVRECHILVVRGGCKTQSIPRPYSQDGAGDCWVLAYKLQNDEESPIDTNDHIAITEGFDPRCALPGKVAPLRTLDLFCGGGNFCRGLEEAGALRAEWAVDMAGPAIHTKLANSHIPPEGLFWGSVTHYLLLAINGAYSRAVAAIGAVQMIIAGSPCQGFSKKQMSKYSEASMRNASMIAILISFLDLYRPEYALFENVNGMAGAYGASGDEYPLDQILCAIVGMGYQVQVWHANAENYGACQSRARVFISIAAPGLQPSRPLQATHTSFTYRQHRGLGRTANNELYGTTGEVEAPHEFVSARQGTAHLPTLHTPQTGVCIQDSDHRASSALNPGWQRIMRFIPRHPPGCGLEQTMRQGLLSVQMLDDAMPQGGKRNTNVGRAFRRVVADKPFDTIVTKADPRDTRGTPAVHWDRDGLMTIAEARCGQGVPESDVLIGNPAQQWKIVGNAVARGPATMLGINLREAWIKSNERFAGTDLLACSAPVELPSMPALSYKELNRMATKSSSSTNTKPTDPSPVKLHDPSSAVKPISIRPGPRRSNIVVAVPNRQTVIPPTVLVMGTEANDSVSNASVGAITGDSVDVAARPTHEVSAGASTDAAMDDPMDASMDDSTDASMDVPMDASMRAPTHALTDASSHALADAPINASVHATANARYYSSLAPSEDDKSRDNIVTASGVTTQEGLDVSEAIPRDNLECGSNADGITIDVGPQAEMLDQQLANNEDAFSQEKDLAIGNSVAMEEVVDIADRLPRTASSDISDDPDVIPCTATSVNRYIMPGDRPQSIYDTQTTPPIGTRYMTPGAPQAARDHVIPIPASTMQQLRSAERSCVVILSQSSSSDEDNVADMETTNSPGTPIDKSTFSCDSPLERSNLQTTIANDFRKLVKVRLAPPVRAAKIKAKEAMECAERAEAQKKARAARVREAAQARAAKRASVTVLGSSLACPSDEIAWQAFDAFDWDWHPYPNLSDSPRRKGEATDKGWAMSPSQKAWATRRARALERARTVKKPVDDASPLPRRSSSEEAVKKEEGDVPEWQTSHDQQSNDTAFTTANLETTRSESRVVTIPSDIRLANADRKARAAKWAARSLAQEDSWIKRCARASQGAEDTANRKMEDCRRAARSLANKQGWVKRRARASQRAENGRSAAQKQGWIKRRARASQQAEAAKQAGNDASRSSRRSLSEEAVKEEEQDGAYEWQTFCNPRSSDNEPPTTKITTTTGRGRGRLRKVQTSDDVPDSSWLSASEGTGDEVYESAEEGLAEEVEWAENFLPGRHRIGDER